MTILVDMAWLAERLQEENLVVLDATLPPVGVKPPVDVRGRYVQEHIPGAVFFDIDELSDHATDLPHMLPSPEEFATAMGRMGVSSAATIVVYEQAGVFSAPRARWMLRTMGAETVYLLHGDLQAWKAAGHPVESGTVSRPEANFVARFNPAAVVSYAELRKKLDAGEQVVDARSAGRFSGEAPEPRPGLSSGHMPGAKNLPFTELSRDGRMKPMDEIRAEYQQRGVDLDRPVTTSCGSGVTAAVLALGLEMAGAQGVSLYDGSWAEYASRPESLIVK